MDGKPSGTHKAPLQRMTARQLTALLKQIHSMPPDFDDESLAPEVYRAAFMLRPSRGELLHHSNHRCQYTSKDYQSTLRALGTTCSMSRTGFCYNNAVMERSFCPRSMNGRSLNRSWTFRTGG